MAAGPEKIDVKRAADDKAKMALLKELAKQAKPVGVESKGTGAKKGKT
jgi:hypothetical protein